MNCAEFQKVLPYIIETGGNGEEDAHLKSCAVCSDLVQDLRYIAEAAKLLLPMQEPGPRVWKGIQGALEREGMVRPLAGTGRFRPQATAVVASHRHWITGSSLMAFAALLLFAIGVLWFHNRTRTAEPTVAVSLAPPAATQVDDDDAQMLSVVQKKSPALAAQYRENLDTVNAYIRDAQHTVDLEPRDMGAREHLLRAYDEKTMLYSMAMQRSEE